jgi:peptidoglycan hydrolase-like protein with peptidoglycan-binding domain
VVHLGAPTEDAANVTLSFTDYIKNVASSEIYPTWPDESLRANILAQISVALNRVYTEYYRSRGYDFDITSSTAFDQSFVFQRDIFENISDIVDEIFTNYIRRNGSLEPLFAAFCDGIEVQCDGLSQWGSVDLANRGLSAIEILRRYYGQDIEIVSDTPIENSVSSAPPIPLKEGDTGRDVELLQRRLNRISVNFPRIPKIYPADGLFDLSTTDAVKEFQKVFGLAEDGLVGKNTWYSIQSVYNAVKRLYELNSEGLKIADLSTEYPSELSEGIEGDGVLVLQYYLSYIANYVPTVRSVTIDGSFGPATKEAVISFQRTYGLPITGVVNRLTWNKMQEIYYSQVQNIPYIFSEGEIIPYPGRILRLGIEGNDVRVLQEYLSFIAKKNPSIPAITPDGAYGPATEAAVRAFVQSYRLPDTNGRVNATIWDAIASIYEDLYAGALVGNDQFPGYPIT